MKKRKNRAQLEAEIEYLRKGKTAESITQVLLSLIRWGAVTLIFYWGYLGIEALAGKSTLADIGINFLTNIKISVALAWGVGTAGTAYGWRQKKLRRDTVERLQGRIKDLESAQDPIRTSSRLTARGDTRPEDKL